MVVKFLSTLKVLNYFSYKEARK